MNGFFKWVKDEKEADFIYGGEQYEITDEDIQCLKNGNILNFFVNMEYGCTLKYSGQVVPDTLQGWRYEERPQGEWIYNQYDGNPNIGNWHCSNCNNICAEMRLAKDDFNYCPNCGAQMKGGAE